MQYCVSIRDRMAFSCVPKSELLDWKRKGEECIELVTRQAREGQCRTMFVMCGEMAGSEKQRPNKNAHTAHTREVNLNHALPRPCKCSA